ncbi:MAG: cohesin domain-containing protein [Candidatus Moranbacteria bacterium]|nr:cohesin domain-containing protein [Candidatus Moranbacteria bacterium]
MASTKEATQNYKKAFLVGVGIIMGAVIMMAYVFFHNDGRQLDLTKGFSLSEASARGNSKKPAPVPVGSALYFEPGTLSVGINQSFPLVAKIDPSTSHVSGAELHITFDPKKVTLESVVPSGTFSVLLQSPNIDNVNGTASLSVGVPLSSASITTVSDTATFTFRAKEAVRDTPINFTDTSLVAADNETGNVLQSAQAAHIRIR